MRSSCTASHVCEEVVLNHHAVRRAGGVRAGVGLSFHLDQSSRRYIITDVHPNGAPPLHSTRSGWKPFFPPGFSSNCCEPFRHGITRTYSTVTHSFPCLDPFLHEIQSECKFYRYKIGFKFFLCRAGVAGLLQIGDTLLSEGATPYALLRDLTWKPRPDFFS